MLGERHTGLWARIVYRIVLSYSFFCRHLPPQTALTFGKALGTLAYFVDVRHRRTIIRNLAFAFDKPRSDKKIRHLALRNFQQFAIIAHEWLRLKNFQFELLYPLVSVEGLEHLFNAKSKSKSVILIGAHFGNWEYAHLYYGKKINRLNFIVRPIDNPFLETERVEYNNRAGVTILYKSNGLRTALKNIRKGEDLVLFVDRNTNLKEGIPCSFFGKKAPSLTIAALLANRFNLPIVPMFIIRKACTTRHSIVFMPELEVEDDGKFDLQHAVQVMCDAVESMIRKYPDHWIWFHKRWKHFYPELYPEDMARRERRRARKRRTMGSPTD